MPVSPEFAQAMVALAEAYNAALTPERISIYGAALADLPLQQVRNAMLRAVRECKFFPTVAELRSFVTPLQDDAALVAWAGLQQAAREVGSYGSLDVDDVCAGEALLAVFGSWPAFCQTEEGPELGAKKAEFAAAYRQARRTAVSAAPTRLSGLFALENERNGGGPPEGWSWRLLASGRVQRGPALPPMAPQRELGE